MAEKTLKKLSIPYNNDYSGTVEILKNYSHFISEVYFPINSNIIGSGRGGSSLPLHDKFLEALIKTAKENDIKSNLIINPMGFSESFSNEKIFTGILNYIDYYSNVLGIEYITVTNPILAKRIPDVTKVSKVVASVNMFINTVEAAKKAEQIGISEIYIDRDRNWDLSFIRNLKESFNGKLRLMLNEGCIPSCIFRYSHFDCVGVMTNDTIDEALNKYDEKHRLLGCSASYSKEPEMFIKTPVIRPEDLKYYDQYIDTFKVVGRTAFTKFNEIRIKAYGEREYKGDFGLFIDNAVARKVLDERNLIIRNEYFPEDFIDRKSKCSKLCSKCNYCKMVAKKVIVRAG